MVACGAAGAARAGVLVEGTPAAVRVTADQAAISDVLAARLGAEHLVPPGYEHTAQLHPDFNEELEEFVLRAEEARTTG